jgi:hypothetical protein
MALLAACHDSDGSDAVNADALVTDLLLNQTNESGEPLEIDGANLVFPADDTAFDDVLPPDTGAVVEQ